MAKKQQAPKTGDIYMFASHPHYRGKLLPRPGAASSSRLCAKYSTYDELFGKAVVVIDAKPVWCRKCTYSPCKCELNPHVCSVYVKNDGPEYNFLITTTYLIPMTKVTGGCSCQINTLLISGCKCGEMQREKSQTPKEYLHQEKLIIPW